MAREPHRVVEGDTPDSIADKVYGRTHGATEAILRANRGLAADGLLLTPGRLVNLPDLAPPATRQTRRLWGQA